MTKGERVKAVRMSLGMTLEGFGSRLGVTKSGVTNVEKGNRDLTDLLAKSICREFNVSYGWLVYGIGEMFDTFPDTLLDELCKVHHLNSDCRFIIKSFVEMDEAERNAFVMCVRKLFIQP